MRTDLVNHEQASGGGNNITSAGGTANSITVPGAPTLPLGAATKGYVDGLFMTLNSGNFVSGVMGAAYLPAFRGEISAIAGTGNFLLPASGVTAGIYTKVTVGVNGIITAGSDITNADIPNLGWGKIVAGKPTTLAGYGISDGATNGSTLTGPLLLSGDPVVPEDLATKGYSDLALGGVSAVITGTVITKPYATAPAGFLSCNGAFVDKTTYAGLYAVIGDVFTYITGTNNGKPWKQQYDINITQSTDITSWILYAGSLLVALSNSQAIVTSNRVYLLGGTNGVAYVSTVYTAPINPDGTLGAWATSTSLPGPLSNSQAIVTNNRVYLLGGYNIGGYASTVYTAPINLDGTLGVWATGTSLPAALSSSQAIVTSNRVYLLGGFNFGEVSTVYTAPINPDGTLGVWATSTSLPGPLSNSQAIVTNNRVYLLGGVNGNVSVSTVYTAPINLDGTLGAWTTGTSLPVTLGCSQAIVTKNRVYLLGGYTASYVATPTVYTAPINIDGTLGAWATGTSLPGPLSNSQAIVTNNKVYLLGGGNGVGDVSTVYTAPILGGVNDYSPYYSGGGTLLTTFGLPDTTLSDPAGLYSYIKF